MKFKILAILAIILGAVCLFATNKVEAYSYASIVEGTLTENSLDNIPDTISVDMKESEFEKVSNFIMEQVVTELNEQGVTLNQSFIQNGSGIGSISVDFENKLYPALSSEAWVMRDYNIYKVEISAYSYLNNSNPINIKKEITIKYNNTKNYNEADKNYVANLMKNMNGITIDVYSGYNVPDGSVAMNKILETLNEKVNDSSIKIFPNGGTGDYTKEILEFAIFKNDVYYQKVKTNANIYWITDDKDIGGNISVSGLLEGVDITVATKENNDMIVAVKNKGFNNIIGAYELKLTGATTLAKPIDITFDVGTEYSDKDIYILHKKNNGTYENFEKKVVDGKVTITVSELSPFVLGVKDDTQNSTEEKSNTDEEMKATEETKPTEIAETTETIDKGEKDQTPKTGVLNINGYILTITILVGVGIVALKNTLK